MLRRVALLRIDVSEDLSASIIRVTRISPPKRWFLQEPHGVTSQKTPFFIFWEDFLLLFHRNTLQQHMKVHTGKDFKCHHEGCIFACRSQAELRNHQRMHSDSRPYQCDTCSYSAKTKPQLLRWGTTSFLPTGEGWQYAFSGVYGETRDRMVYTDNSFSYDIIHLH
jgi:hypothetical protein